MFYQILPLVPVLVLAHALYQYLRLRHVPGPFLASISKLWWIKWALWGALHVGLLEASRKYGSHVLRVGPNEVVTDDPHVIRRINGVRSRYTRSRWYDSTALSHRRNHVFCERDETKHTTLRNHMFAGYSGKENPSLEASVDEQLIHFINLIQEKYLSSASLSRLVDFARIAQYFALDVITDVASGKPYGFIETDSDVHDYLKIQSILFPIFECFSTLPSLERLIRFPPISKAVMPTAKDSKGLGHLMGVAEDIVNDRYDKAEREVSQPDMLGSFIRHGLPREQAKIEAVLQVIAGSDTTVTALRMTVLSISTSSTVLREVLAEIDEADRSGKLSKPIALETEIRSHLPYLCACVKESLRLWPPVTGLFFKDVPQGGDVVDGAFLPGGTRLGYNAWALHRSKSLYGEDADIYRPSRWLEEAKDPDRLAEMTRSVDLIFGHGKYGCLGKPVALMELHKAVTELFRRFDFAVVNPLEAMQSRNRNGLFVQWDMWMRIDARQRTNDGMSLSE